MSAGLDSLAAVELRNTLQSRFSINVPATATFDYPTATALARFIGNQLSLQGGATAHPVTGVQTDAGAALPVEQVAQILQEAVAEVLGAAAAPDQPLMEAGLDSLGELAIRLAF